MNREDERGIAPQERNDTPRHKTGYPLFLDLKSRLVVVVGGGTVAERKVDTLLEYGPSIRVVSPEATRALRDRAAQGAITWLRRPYQDGDLAGAALVFSACGDPAVDALVCGEAHGRNCPVNVVDVAERCDFIVPSVLRRGALSIAVSTSGAAPFEAKAIRRGLEESFDESWTPYLDLMSQVRTLAKAMVPGDESRRAVLYDAIRSANVRQRLAAGESLSARQVLHDAARTCGVVLEEGI